MFADQLLLMLGNQLEALPSVYLMKFVVSCITSIAELLAAMIEVQL